MWSRLPAVRAGRYGKTGLPNASSCPPRDRKYSARQQACSKVNSWIIIRRVGPCGRTRGRICRAAQFFWTVKPYIVATKPIDVISFAKRTQTQKSRQTRDLRVLRAMRCERRYR